MSKIRFLTTNNTVTHLGRNLYSTTPPALAELIANAYDAYATMVDIKIVDGSHIIIADNGKGMRIDELESKYCKIGQPKQREKPVNDLPPRNPMGRKGIGKLASFSIGNQCDIFTKTASDSKWIKFTLVYDEMLLNDPYEVEFQLMDKLPEEYNYWDFSSGFIIKISELRRKFSASSEASFMNQISKRFYLKSDHFSLNLNDKEIYLSKNSYYENLQFVLYFGYRREEIESVFENKKIELKEFNEKLISEYIENNKIKGWIGSVAKPRDLSKDGNSTSIIVYINNKLADENVFKNRPDARLATQYIVGEIQADFLDQDSDPVTSSRQGLDETNDNVKDFINKIEEIRKKFILLWDNFRVKNAVDSLPERIKSNKSYQEWLSGLSGDEKKINNKLLNLFSDRLDDEDDPDSITLDSMITSIAGVINNVSIIELIKRIDGKEMGSEDQFFSLVSLLMEKVEKEEQLTTAELISARISAIKKLEDLMDNGEMKEKFFQDHLYKNPWLINPFWNYNDDINFSRVKEKYLSSIDDNGKKNKHFIDILIKTSEEKYPIIVELKKNTPTGHAKVKYSQMHDQIKEYRQALIGSLTEIEKNQIKPSDILAIFILPEDTSTSSFNTIEIDESELRMLKQNNIKLYTYAELLENAKNLYKDFILAIRNKKLIPNLSESHKED